MVDTNCNLCFLVATLLKTLVAFAVALAFFGAAPAEKAYSRRMDKALTAIRATRRIRRIDAFERGIENELLSLTRRYSQAKVGGTGQRGRLFVNRI